MAVFNRATFSDVASFVGATFSGGAIFDGATFSSMAVFNRATFSDAVGFEGATFSGEALFEGATFSSITSFDRATFSSMASFHRAIFSDWAIFDRATFFDRTRFDRATFESEISFVNAKMKSETRFTAAKFSSWPPAFFGAKLHEGTVWRDVHWPDPPTQAEADDAGYFVDAYERLKLEMDRLKKHEDELDFFARELQCRRSLYGDWKPLSELRFFGRRIAVPPLKIPEATIARMSCFLFGCSVALPATITLHRPAPGLPIALYGLLCDYGRSYIRPLWGLLATIAAAIPLFWLWFGLAHAGQAIAISLANTFGALGFRKDFIDPKLVETLPGVLQIVAGLQTIAGTALLFLLGLALRNRFRMK